MESNGSIWPSWCKACQRRNTSEKSSSPAGAPRQLPAIAAKAKAKLAAKASVGSKYSNDYSKWKNFQDSDSDEEKKKEQAKKNEAELKKEQDARKEWEKKQQDEAFDALGSLSRWSGKGLTIVDEFKDICRRTRSEFQDQMPSRLKEKMMEQGDRPEPVELPENYQKPVGVLKLKELEKYNCVSDRKLVSVYGDIFDVSSRPDLYGLGGKSSFKVGADITWTVITGSEKAADLNQFYDFFKLESREHLQRYLHLISNHLVAFEADFGPPVGQLFEYKDDASLPAM